MDVTAGMVPRRVPAGNVASYQNAGGVVFDCDGVLADTTPCWEDAFLGVAREIDLALSSDQLAELRGAALTTATQRLAQWSRRPLRPDKVLGRLREQLMRAIDTSDLLLADGVRDLLNELYGVVSIGVASNSPRAVLLHILARLEITEYFTAAISAEDVTRPKPAPDPYLAVCQALGVDPRMSFAVEDSEIGIRSALAAGLTVIELAESPTLSPDGTQAPGSALRVSSLADRRVRLLILGQLTPSDPPSTESNSA